MQETPSVNKPQFTPSLPSGKTVEEEKGTPLEYSTPSPSFVPQAWQGSKELSSSSNNSIPEFETAWDMIEWERETGQKVPREVRDEVMLRELRNVPFSLERQRNKDVIERPNILQQFGATWANFAEELWFGQDLFDIDDRVQQAPFVETMTMYLGSMVNIIGLSTLGNTAVTLGANQLKGVPWIAKATATTGTFLKGAPSVVKGALKAGEITVRRTGVGLTVAGARQLVAPEERKPGAEGTERLVTKFVAGDLAQALMGVVLDKYLPGVAGTSFERLLTFFADATGETLGAFLMGHVETPEEALDELFSAETLGIAVADLLFYHLSKGTFKRTPQVDAMEDALTKARRNFENNPSEANQREVWNALADLWVTINPGDVDEFTDALIHAYDYDISGIIKTQFIDTIEVEPSKLSVIDEPTKKIATTKKNIVTDSVPKLDDLGQRILDEGGLKVSEAEAKHLDKARPADGDAFNTSKMDAEPEVKKLVQEASEIVKDTEVQTHEMTKSKARSLYRNVDDLLDQGKILAGAVEEGAPLVYQLGETTTALAKDLTAEAKRIKGLGDSVTPEDLLEFETQWYLFEEGHTLLNHILTGTARTLNIRNVTVSGEETGRFLLDSKSPTATDVVRRPSKVLITDDTVPKKFSESGTLILDIVNKVADSEGEILGVSKKGIPSMDERLTRMGLELRSSVLLSQWFTGLKNMGAQTLWAGYNIAENYASATTNLIGTAINKVRGKDFEGGVTFSEANARAKGQLEGIFRGIYEPFVDMRKLATVEAYATGSKPPSILSLVWDRVLNPEKIEDLLESTGNTSRRSAEGLSRSYMSSDYLFPNAPDTPLINGVLKVYDWMGAQIRLAGFGMMEITDRPFSTGGYFDGLYGELTRRINAGEITVEDAEILERQVLAWRDYSNTVKFVENLERQGVKVDVEAVSRQIHDVTEGQLVGLNVDDLKVLQNLHEVAVAKSDYMTYKDELQSQLLRDIEVTRRNSLGMQLLMPFYHTPARIYENWWYKQPLNKQIWEDALGKTKNSYGEVDRERQTRAWGQVAVSSSLYFMAYKLFTEGKLTPTARNSRERKAMEEAGVPEASLKVGDNWVRLNGYDPFTTYLNTMANVMRIVAERNEEQYDDENSSLILEVVTSVAQSVLSETWATTVREGIDLVTSGDPEDYRRFMERTARTFNPLQPQYNNITGTSLGGLNPFYKDYMENVQWYPFETKPRLDTYGKPLLKWSSVGGVRYSEPSDSPIRQEVVKLNMTLQQVPTHFRGVRLSDDQRYAVNEYLDTMLNAEEQMNKIITDPGYRYAQMSVDMKRDLIRDSWRSIINKALESVLRDDPEFLGLWSEGLGGLFKEDVSLGGDSYRDKWFE